ncbi:unnamed protein product [Bursaphelenchus xylophilus]|uniref:Hexosyltransferase n=1 Tax=Bursaphelenchus xylophilus TaxID=6326 RepID=A0A1I7S623_BURXY|nr:unnamed protein product [Bursaphelenchus xylophilus]CAG9082358.1 unnamed protein product [Bursaphelenchus xylophilus]
MSWLKNSYIWIGCVVTFQLLIFAFLLTFRPSFESLVPLIGYYTNRSLNATWTSRIYNRALFGNGGMNWAAVYRFDQQLDPFLADLMETVTLTFKDHQVDYQMTRPVNSNVCDGVDAVVYVMTTLSRQATERREVMRNIMFNKTNLPSNYTVLHRYVVGRYPAEREYQKQIIEEMKQFDDVIMFNIDENYYHNYIKWHTMHAWHMRHCPDVKYLIKMDEYVVVYLKRLFQWLDRGFGGKLNGKKKFMVGNAREGPVERRVHERAFVPYEQFAGSQYPVYADGPLILTTNDAVVDLINTYKTMNYVRIDDVFYSGIARERAGIEVIGFEGFDGGKRKCSADGLPFSVSKSHGGQQQNAKGMVQTLESIKNIKCKIK